jgi:hypothetical protein
MRKWALPLTIILAMLALAAPPNAGAAVLVGEHVQVALDRTDERIELAQSLTASADNQQAELEVSAAVEVQAQAKAVFQQAMAATGEMQSRLFQQTIELTLRARARADRAIALIRGLPDPERVMSQIERTRDLLDRARDKIEECDNDRARALLRVALEMQARAEAAVRESRYLAALQLTLSARERALRALRLCNAEENLQEAAERALRRTDEVLSRATEVVEEHGNERAQEVLKRAERIQTEAHAQFRASHFAVSLRLTLSARTLAYRAIRISGGGV